MTLLGSWIAGGNGTRRDKDFYPTPIEATEALLRARLIPAQGQVWEPACGDGAISRVLERNGYGVYSSDLVDRNYGAGGVDFLQARDSRAEIIVTNPPFALAEDFIRHALRLKVKTLALLLKMQFWNAAVRIPLFKEHQPAVVAPLTWRLDFTGGGNPTMDCAWVVWGEPWTPCTTHFRPLAKPDLLAEMLA